MGKSDFKQAFMARIRRAREARGLTQDEMATLLRINQAKYHKYESRSYMPHDLVPLFCLAAGIDMHWLFTGRASKAETAESAAESRRPTLSRRRRKAG